MKHPNLPETSEIMLRINEYGDIFSDFDIRPYSKRSLSFDFLEEVKRAALDKEEGGVELTLHAPEKAREESKETVIKERLVSHFRRHYHLLLKEKRRMLKIGWSMVVFGVIFMIVATMIIFEDPAHNLLLSFLVVFLEPAAWFLLWEGMDQVIFSSKKNNSELYFYRKMSDSRAQIHFKSY